MRQDISQSAVGRTEKRQPVAKHLGQTYGVGLRRFVVGVAVFLVIYVFSFGPALSLAERGYISQKALPMVYGAIPLKLRLWYLEIWKRLDRKCRERLYAIRSYSHYSQFVIDSRIEITIVRTRLA